MENLYDSPEAPVIPEKSINAGNLSETMLRHLKDASPWLRFIGIMGYIGCGFIALAAIFSIAGSASFSSITGNLEIPVWIFSPFYAAFGILFFFPAHFTYCFGKYIRNYQISNADEDLEKAFKNNKSLWKFYGILCIIYLSIIPFVIVISVIIAIVAATNLF